MSSMSELTFFLGLQVTQKDDGIFISQDKYVDEILKKFCFSTMKTSSTHMETSKPLLKDVEAEDVDVHLYRLMIGSLMYLITSRPDIIFVVYACARFQAFGKDSPFDLEAYTDSDYAGASLDRKSTTGGCQFLGRRLISWQCKKKTIVANFTTEAKYVVASSCRGQVLWIQNQMLDYGYNFMNTKIFIDNESTICIVKNPVFHSKTKHIEIRHHFIRDSYEKRLIQVIKIHTNHNVADLLTKAFDSSGPIPFVIDETVIKEWEDKMERAATTAFSLEAEQDSGNINRTQSIATLNESLPQGTGSGSGPRCQDTILGGVEAQIRSSELFWATAKAKTVNGERQIQALVDKKKVIITEKSVRSDLMLEDAERTECLLNDVIFEQLTLMSAKTTAWNEFSSTMASAIIFQAPEDMGKYLTTLTDSHSTPIITQPSSSKPQKKRSRRKQMKDNVPTEPIPDEATNEEPISTPSCDLPQSEEAKTAQAKEIVSLKKRVKQLEKRRKSRTSGLKRLRKVGSASRVESSNDVSLGAQEDAS
ncbi:hypothetical protein Tco_0834001, partial [Tanacetum coccineum]